MMPNKAQPTLIYLETGLPNSSWSCVWNKTYDQDGILVAAIAKATDKKAEMKRLCQRP